jgi:hypothetical protein
VEARALGEELEQMEAARFCALLERAKGNK